MILSLLGDCESPLCRDEAERWLRWAGERFSRFPPAMIDLAVDYQELVGPKGRNMVRKARRQYSYGRYIFNEHLQGMYEINTSLPERSGRPMESGYLHPVHAIVEQTRCPRHATIYIGGFHYGVLRAYCYLAICGELAVINRILGHGDALPDGVMNGLMVELVREAREHGAKMLNYLTMESATQGLTNFKRHTGFRPTEVEFAL